MSRFNLEFSGEIRSGRDRAEAMAGFARLFAIDDPDRLLRFFSGDTVVLRRNLDRKEAAQWYRKLRDLGAEAQLVVVEDEPEAPAAVPQAERQPDPEPAPTPKPEPEPLHSASAPKARPSQHDFETASSRAHQQAAARLVQEVSPRLGETCV